MQKISLFLPILMLFSCSRSKNSPAPTPPLSSDYIVSTYADLTVQNGLPIGVAEDPSGNLYACDVKSGAVWKITPDSNISMITTIYGETSDLVCDKQGNVYVLAFSQRSIIKITPAGIVTTLAGGNNSLGVQYDGQGSAAGFKVPNGLDIDSTGTLYVADFQSIRKVDQDGQVTTLYKDTTSNTQFLGVTIDSYHNIYYSNGGEIWRLDTLGNRTFVAGQHLLASSSVDGTGSSASFEAIYKLRMDKNGNFWAGDYAKIRMITPSGVVTTIAGTGTAGFADGPGNIAEFAFANGLAIDQDGTVFVADATNKKIRKIVHK
jgi:sugar lactone lactonase YvrE